jgi:hypothetical protein
MKKVILHIGYSKTATTTMQEALFMNLHKKGVINYLGKSEYYKNQNEVQYSDDIIKDYLCGNHNFTGKDITLSSKKINIYSREVFTNPKIYLDKRKDIKIKDPLLFPERFKSFFSDKADDIVILVTLRNQQQLINSSFAQFYNYFMDDEKINTWNKYFSLGIDKEEDMFNMYHFYDVLTKYASYFGDSNVCVLLFEDLIDKKEDFIKKLSEIIRVDYEEIKSALTKNHFRQRKKTDNSYIRDVKQRNMIGKLLLQLKRNNFISSFYKKIKDYYGNNNLLLNIYKKIGKKKARYNISKPTSGQKEIIFNKFRKKNLKIVEEFDVKERKFKEYNYI